MKAMKVVAVIVTVVAVLAACAPGPNRLMGQVDEEDTVYGFWYGLWHGFISPVTFIISLFNGNVSPYEVHNNGGWYNFGFILGAMTIFGGGGGSASRAGRRRG